MQEETRRQRRLGARPGRAHPVHLLVARPQEPGRQWTRTSNSCGSQPSGATRQASTTSLRTFGQEAGPRLFGGHTEKSHSSLHNKLL